MVRNNSRKSQSLEMTKAGVNMLVVEEPLIFPCHGKTLYGILHRPAVPASMGVVIVVGGPQYRVGSHRQFVLLARMLSKHGVPVLRFDYRGMGDSEGSHSGFEGVGEDIHAAIDSFMTNYARMNGVVLWGLCDAASAIAFYASSDPRVKGLVLLNPWVRTEQGIARTQLKHYYLVRLFDVDAWHRLIRGKMDIKASLVSLTTTLMNMLFSQKKATENKGLVFEGDTIDEEANNANKDEPLAYRMLSGLQRFSGSVLFILSGDDLTAAEFKSTANKSRHWRRFFKEHRVTIKCFTEADHTFSKNSWRKQVEDWTYSWLQNW